MNAFAATESDLPLRIRRTLRECARRMGTLARMLAAILLCLLAALTLPSCGATGKRTGGDMEALAAKGTMAEAGRIDGIWREGMATDPDEWSKALILALPPDFTIEEIANAVRQRRLWREAHATDPDEWSEELKAGLVLQDSSIEEIAEGIRQRRLWREAHATDPDEWSEELKAGLALPDSTTIEEIAEGIRQRRLWQEAHATDPDEWSEELKARLRAFEPDITIEQIAKAVRKSQEDARPHLRALVVVERAMATPPEEWSEELKADIERDGWDLDEFSEGIRSRRVWEEANATDPGEWSEELKTRILALKAQE